MIRKPVIAGFILFHFTLILLQFFPDNLMAQKLKEPFNRYFMFIGLPQAFNVFAPSPRRRNIHVMATITYRDGVTQVYSPPRLDRIPLIEKLFRERYRKYLADNLPSGINKYLSVDLARYIARKYNRFKDNPPATVSILCYVSAIPPIENGSSKEFFDLQTQLDSTDDILRDWQIKEAPSVSRKDYVFNSFGNRLNPPRASVVAMEVYQVKPEDLK